MICNVHDLHGVQENSEVKPFGGGVFPIFFPREVTNVLPPSSLVHFQIINDRPLFKVSQTEFQISMRKLLEVD